MVKSVRNQWNHMVIESVMGRKLGRQCADCLFGSSNVESKRCLKRRECLRRSVNTWGVRALYICHENELHPDGRVLQDGSGGS